MKILHVTECVGGGVSRALDQIPGRAPEHEHHLLSVNPGVQNPTGRGFLSQTALPPGHIRRVLAVRRLVRDLKPDIIHAHSSWAGFYTRALWLPGHVVYQPHGYALELGGPVRRAVFTLAEKLLAMRLTSVAVLSPHEVAVARRLNSRSRRILVPNVPTVAPLVRQPSVKRQRVITVGRIGSQKDPEYFSSLRDMVVASNPSIEFWWIGDGNTEMRRSLTERGIHVTGWLDDADLVSELVTASLYVHAGKYEGFPLSVLDAAACGLPILVRAIPAFQGSELAQFAKLEEHADAVRAFFSGSLALQGLLDRNVELLSQMNPDRLEKALARLYESPPTGSRSTAQDIGFS